jgi:uncharacterized protein YndB with AHSA1/START domain
VPATPSGTRTVEHEVRIEAPPEIVFAHFTDPARMAQWMGTDAMLDPRPGGRCRLTMAGGAVISGQFVEVAPYSRVVFTWGWEADLFAVPPASTRVDVSLVPDGDATVVRIVHRELPQVAVPAHKAGWEHYSERLKMAAEGGNPGRDDWVVPPELWPSPPAGRA